MSESRHPHSHPTLAQTTLPKVPEIIPLFWLIKLLTTGMGEAMSDFLGNTSIPLAVAVAVIPFPLAIWLQLRSKRYIAPIYWFAVSMVAVFGTAAADGIHIGLHIPYAASTAFWGAIVAFTFWRWYRSEGTLSIHSIVTPRRERLYWATVFSTFALGTAAGDLTATEMNLGFFPSALIFGAIMLIPLIGWRMRWMSSIVAFWFAYVITRPLGASFADGFGKPHAISGMDYGDGTVTLVSACAIALLVAWVWLRRPDIQHWAVVDADLPPVLEPDSDDEHRARVAQASSAERSPIGTTSPPS